MRELYIYDKYRSAFRPVLENYHLRNTPFVEFLINHSSRVRVAAFDVRRSTFDIQHSRRRRETRYYRRP